MTKLNQMKCTDGWYYFKKSKQPNLLLIMVSSLARNNMKAKLIYIDLMTKAHGTEPYI